ncbi:MAG: ABC transporter substrate-binding protein, partial [Acetobacteraceae bacterium]|nr:ABC transporter substrate-binding protein [Acetobacteraceae bacterium]
MLNLKNTLTLAVAASTLAVAAPAIAQDTGATIGFIGGFTGPIESLTPPIFAGAELVVKQVNEQGGILGGELKIVSADGACDATAAAAAADKVINTDNVVGIVGALCTGETIGAFNGSGLSGNVVFISPASSAPALTTLEDNDLVYRTTPSDALQG